MTYKPASPWYFFPAGYIVTHCNGFARRHPVADATRFDEFASYCDAELSDPGLLLYIESDLGVTISDAEAQRIAEKDLGELVHFIAERQCAAKITGNQ